FNTLSKRSSMTGYRSGFVAADGELTAALKQYRPSVGTAPQEFVQRASIVAWNDEEHVERTRDAYRRKREALLPALARKGVRVAGGWRGNGDAQTAILEYFRLRKMEPQEVGPFEYHDKIPLKRNYEQLGVRVVPPAVARYGAFLSPGVVMMPSYVNIGAWVGPRTMVDTWATVGSGAQIGADVHLAGGVGVGGVLEPPGARPVIVEDGAFIGSRRILTE